MEKRRWKENPKYSEDDLLYRIAEAVGDIPAPLDADYGECAVIGGVPARRTEMPFKITDLSLSPSRIVLPDQEIFEDEKERLKKNVKAALSKFRSSRLEHLKRLYSPDAKVQKALDEMDIPGDLPEVLDEAKKRLKEQGFSDKQIESVCFMPKEKAMKFATDDLATFFETADVRFRRALRQALELRSGGKKEGPCHRDTGVGRSRRRVGSGREGKRQKSLSRPSFKALAFRRQLCPADEEHIGIFLSLLSDFDTMLGAFVVSGMFPPVALLYLLPIIVPGLLDLIFFGSVGIETEKGGRL